MKVFLDHCHQDKALPFSGRSIAPARTYIGVNRRLRTPDSADINVSIRNAIQDEPDFVIIFLSREATKPEWVRRECECVHEREKSLSNNA